MKFNRLGAFTLGVVITAVSVGAVSFVNAAGDKTLKACANKTTGIMRYISKGSCKKTETSLSWSQMGPQGLSGSAGIAGANGTVGTKGEAGAAGTNGVNGQNYYAVDATGKTIGPILGHVGTLMDILIDNMIWQSYSHYYAFQNTSGHSDFRYLDSTCLTPYAEYDIGTTPSPQGIAIDFGAFNAWDVTDKAYKVSGSQISLAGKTVYRWKFITSNYFCTAYTELEMRDMAFSLYPLTEVTKPAYTAPLTIVAK